MAIYSRKSFTAARAALPQGQWQRLLIKTGLAGVIAILCMWLLADRLSGLPLSETRLHISSLAPGQWLTAILATALSF